MSHNPRLITKTITYQHNANNQRVAGRWVEETRCQVITITFAGCRWRLVKDIEEERKTRTYIICDVCETERITSDTGWITENRTRNGAEYYKTTRLRGQ